MYSRDTGRGNSREPTASSLSLSARVAKVSARCLRAVPSHAPSAPHNGEHVCSQHLDRGPRRKPPAGRHRPRARRPQSPRARKSQRSPGAPPAPPTSAQPESGLVDFRADQRSARKWAAPSVRRWAEPPPKGLQRPLPGPAARRCEATREGPGPGGRGRASSFRGKKRTGCPHWSSACSSTVGALVWFSTALGPPRSLKFVCGASTSHPSSFAGLPGRTSS